MARILQRANWTDRENLNDLDVLERYDREYPGTLKDDMLRHPAKHVYRLVVQLMTPAKVAAILDDLVLQGADTQPYPRGAKDFFANPAYAVPREQDMVGAEHDARDHMLPNGVVLHRHRTWSANNRGPRLGDDPYFGTGLDPAKTWGVVAPRDGCDPEMACCGQVVKSLVDLEKGEPPGCWIALDETQEPGTLVPYQMWYDALPGEALWTATLQATTEQRFSELIRTGTAFLNEGYYRKLDARIRGLARDVVIPAVLRVHRELHKITESAFARLNAPERAALMDMVSLVQLYNAPQNGACNPDALLTEPDVNARVFHMAQGKAAFYGGRLRSLMRIHGVDVPLVLTQPVDRALRSTQAALRLAGASDAADALETVLRLNVDEVTAQQALSGAAAQREAVVSRPFAVTLPEALAQRWRANQALYDAARDLADRLRGLLSGMPSEINAWLVNNEGPNVPPAVGFQTKIREASTTLAELGTQTRVLEADTRNLGAELDRYRVLEDTARRAAAEEQARQEAEARARAEAAAAAAEASRIASQRSGLRQEERFFTLPSDARNKATEMVQMTPVPAPPQPVVVGNSFRWEANSCAYDAFFAALFKVPNQWFRQTVRAAQLVRIPAKTLQPGEAVCSDVSVLQLHNALVEGIQFVEDGTRAPTVCPLPSVWQTCMATRRARSGIRDDPEELLMALVNFYQLEAMVYSYVFEEPEATIPSGREMIISQPNNSLALLEGQAYNLPLQLRRGEYQLSACFIYSNESGAEHFDAAVRDPRTRRWVIYRTTGQPLPSQNPGADPAPEATQRTKRDPSARSSFVPTAWIYLRTERLAAFVPQDLRQANEILAAVETERARFYAVPRERATSVYPRLKALLGNLEAALYDDIRGGDVTILRRVRKPLLRYYDRGTAPISADFSLPMFIVMSLLGRTGVVWDANVMSTAGADDAEIAASVAANVPKFALPWQSARVAVGSLLARLKWMPDLGGGTYGWGQLRPRNVLQMTQEWGVTSQELPQVWIRISKVFELSLSPTALSEAQKLEFQQAYNFVWQIIKD